MTEAYDNIDTGAQGQDYLLQLFGGLNSAMTTMSAVELHIFDILSKDSQPMSAAKIAEVKNYNIDATSRLLNTLVSIKLVEQMKDSDGRVLYKNSSSGRLLASTEPDNLVGLVERFSSRFADVLRHKLPQEVRSGSMRDATFPAHVTVHKESMESFSKAPEQNKEEKPAGTPCPAAKEDLYPRYLAMHNNLQPHVQHIVSSVDFSVHKTAVDLGGGSGVLTYALSEKYSQMNITLFEVPPVINLVEKRFLIHQKSTENIKLLAGDFMQDDLPTADLYMLSQIVHDWRPDQVNTILKKVFSVLNKGGGILLLEQCLDDDKVGPASATVRDLLIMSSCGGGLRSAKEFTDLLIVLGFIDVQVKKTQPWCMYDVIYARKP